ncbi:ATP-binding protein [Octadecabacter sp. CECT 8868]|uniref:ATP-binding protein n=1 Tax=Octadecabacter algicola TaxID=2909342 RepID=UPI001F397C34|nr:ATP-binding protein [Octadecabacter algicola]MCF2906195.1 ATP-binding protein [Octadecabacter algicola]
MSEFVNETYRDAAANAAGRLFPLDRATLLQRDFIRKFSTHLGHLIGGGQFEAEGLLVTGQSGSGKTTEIRSLLQRFNADGVELPNGMPARFAEVSLKGVETWKDFCKSTSDAVGFTIAEKARLTQGDIWGIVIREAKINGFIGIHFDEVQHIFRKKSEVDRLAVLDSFKSWMKSHKWPLMLIFSGVPELNVYMREEPQLYRLLDRLPFEDISLPEDYQTIHEIVGSYAISAGLEVDPDLMTQDFLDRLVCAGAYRWGLVLKLTSFACTIAQDASSTSLTRDHFVKWWVNKTKAAKIATPFLHSGYETMYRRDHPFIEAIAD